MNKIRKITALLLALVLLSASALADWEAAGNNNQRFLKLLRLLGETVTEDKPLNTRKVDSVLADIRKVSEDDYDVGRAIADHWQTHVLDASYRLYVWQGGERAEELEQGGLDLSGKHAFIVLGYRLENGEMTEELYGRCDAAAAAAASYPDAILITTGGATGSGNPERHTEAGEMKKYLSARWGIAPERIFTETDAMTTLENALNTFRILEENGIETFTIVTSDYHQLWAQVLFNAKAATYEKETGYTLRMVGNYCYPAQPDASRKRNAKVGLNQLTTMFGAER